MTPRLGRLAGWLALGTVVVGSMGASCSPRGGSPFVAGPPAPVVLTPTSTAAEVVAAVNANTAGVQTYQAPQASIALPESAGLALVSASVAIERPQRFRLRATTAITGPELDLGSNDERFWIWARRNEPPALYTARHDLWATSPVRGQLPIEPGWLVEALGLVMLDPAAEYFGPAPRGPGQLELRTAMPGPDGPRQRVLVLDAQTAVVREQHVYDARGSLAASAVADQFRYDPVTRSSLPERVRVSVPAAGLNLTITTGRVTLNAPVGTDGQVWKLPEIGSYPVIDLTAPGGAPATASGPWDLAGSGSVYGRPTPIATPYASAASASPPTGEPSTLSAAGSPAAPFVPPTGFAGLGTPGVVPAPPTSVGTGFVGLPAGGRALE